MRDSRIREIIRFYDRLSNLERIKSRLSTLSFELPTLSGGDADRAKALGEEYASALNEVIRRIDLLLPELESLINKLPQG